MRFVIFSPFALPSAIGRVTGLLVGALLRQGHDAVVVRTEAAELLSTPMHACAAAVIGWTDTAAVEAAARHADARIYQIGNNHAYHCGGLHWMPRLPGIVCLHDFLLSHCFAEWAEGRRGEADDVLRSWYGDDAPAEFFDASSETEFIEMSTRRFPMTEWICSQASAVVAHSRWGMDRVALACAGPLRVLALPYDAPGAAAAPPQRTHLPHERIEILTVGHANPNKRIDSVIRAIGASDSLRGRVSYRLCGRIATGMAADLARLAEAEGVELVISGEISDEGLQDAMHRADIVCCLRWPSFESASASTIEALRYGKAVVVTDAAFYSEIPDEFVRKISPDDEVAELRAVLESLVSDPASRRAMAARGRDWAERTFDADRYVQALATLAVATAAAQPALDMTATLVDYLRGWEASPEIMTSDHLSKPLALFGEPTGRAASAHGGDDILPQKHTP